MLKLSYPLTVLTASIHLITAVQNIGLPSNIQRCKSTDDACIPRVFTHLIQNSTEYPELSIPNLYQYRPQKAWMTHTRGYDTLKLLSYTVHSSDISIHGLNTLQVYRVSGFGPNQNCTDIHAELSIPWVEFDSSFKANVGILSLLHFPASGNSTAEVSCIKISLRIKSEIIERNGKQYLQINNINLSYQILCDIKMNLRFDTLMPELAQDVLNEQANSNWRHIKPLVEADCEEYISEIVHKTITPIFTNVPIQDFFY